MPRNKQIFTGRTIRQWSGGEITTRRSLSQLELQQYVGSLVNKGMITSIDSAEIPTEALQYAKNAKVVFDKTSRRDGLILFGPTEPNNEAVLKMASIKHPDGSGHTYRFTPTTIHDLQSGVWNAITETVALAGTVADRLNVANLLDIIVFTNNGANNVQWIDSNTDTSDDLIDNLSADLGDSEFRYCTGFFERVVLGALREENEVMLAWTGQYGSQAAPKHGLEDLDPIVNETSGFTPLIESPADLSDFITGVFGLTSVLVILREKSIWLATKQASATNPFNAYAAVPGVGCDSPYSAKITRYGLAWLDRRSRTVYHYTPGGVPEPIGRPVEKSIINNITDPTLVFGAYDPLEDTYSVCIPAVGSDLVQTWTYYFQSQAWTYNEYSSISSFDEAELLTAFTAIDDLVGTMGGLTGTFDDLSPVNESESKRLFGFTNGALATPDIDADTDWNFSMDTFLTSKTFMIPAHDTYVAMVVIELNCRIAGQVGLWYAPDGGVDPSTSFIHGITFNVAAVNKPQIFTFRKVVHSRRYAFALRAQSGRFDVLGYELWVVPGGDISEVRQVS